MLTTDHYIDLVDGRFNKTTPAQLDHLFEALAKSPTPDHLVIHFHGGLVSRKAAESTATTDLYPCYTAGAAYPVFFFWHSDLWTTITRNLDEIAREDLFKALVRRLLRLAGSALASSAGTRASGVVPLKSLNEIPADAEGMALYAKGIEPLVGESIIVGDLFFQQASAELQRDPVLAAETAAIAVTTLPQEVIVTARAAGVVPAPKPTKLSPRLLAQITQEQSAMVSTRSLTALLAVARAAVVVLKNVMKRYASGRGHGLYTTIVEEVLREIYIDDAAAIVWKMMKNDTRDAFGDDPLVHGGTAFVAGLKAWWKPGRRITLVGHSTGAIYIGHFLKALDASLPVDARVRVALLAPACTFSFFSEHRAFLKARVEQIRMFAMTDALERGYWEVPGVYPASLLYLVSGLCEPDEVDMPLVGMQRYHSASGPYARPEIQQVAADLTGHIVWSTTIGAPGGLNSTAKKHGDFDNDGPTLSSLTEFLK